MKTKLLLTLITVLGLSGCISSNYYVLSTASQPSVIYTYKNQVIGVEKITVPKYLFKREIAVAKSASQIIFLDGAVWAEDLDAGLTHRLIGFLQKKFNQPSVFVYPWGVDKQPTIKVKVHVTRFIAQGDRVYLDANLPSLDGQWSTQTTRHTFSVEGDVLTLSGVPYTRVEGAKK